MIKSKGKGKPIPPVARFLFSRVFPLPIILYGAMILFSGVKGLYLANESETWPIADGTIQESTVIARAGMTSTSDNTHPMRMSHSAPSQPKTSYYPGTYGPRIIYQFTIDGQTHRGNKVSFGAIPGSNDPSCANEIVHRYPKGAAVKVHYRIGDPDTCIIEPGLTLGSWFMPALGAITIMVGILMVLFVPKMTIS